MQKFCQRLLIVAGGQQLLALGHVRGRSRDPHPIERGAVAQILAVLFVGFLIIVEGGVVILTRLGGLAALEKGAGRLGAQRGAEQAEDGQNGKKHDPKCCSREDGLAGCLCINAAVHRTPRRLCRPALLSGAMRAALAARDAIPVAIPMGNTFHPTLLHFSKAPLSAV